MPTSRSRFLKICVLGLLLLAPALAGAEEDGGEAAPPPTPKASSKKRKYMIGDPTRIDAGVFHVGFAAGGNFYIEPVVVKATNQTNGDYFKDFGFQGGVYFD